MIDRPALARAMAAYRVPDDSVILTSPTGDFLLTGAIYGHLIPLLDGARNADSIAEALSDDFNPAEVYYALLCLEAENCLSEGPPVPAPVGSLDCDGVQLVFGDDPLFIAESSNSPWQFVTATADGYWIGPRSDSTGPCWDCLTFQLLSNRPLAAFVRSEKPRVIMPARDHIAPPPELVQRAAGHTAKAVLVATDLRGNELARHVVRRRPECPRCGDPTLYAQRPGTLIQFKRETRVTDVTAFVELNARLLDPVTGIARGVRRLEGAEPAHVYIGGPNRANSSGRLRDITRHLRSFASGKGRDDVNARASLIGEIAERYSAVFRGEEPHFTATLSSIGGEGMNPNEVMLFSERQLRLREELATGDDPIPHALTQDEPIEWTPVWSLTAQRRKLLPTSLLYFNVPDEFGGRHCIADSNGNAAGATPEAAMLQGLLELIERDAVGIWWFNEVFRPALNLHEMSNKWIGEIALHLENQGRDLTVLDVTSDLGVPVYAAVSRRLGSDSEEILFGFGAHVDPGAAALRAITELGQTLSVMREIEKTGAPFSASLSQWLETGSGKAMPFLVAHGKTSLPDPMAETLSAGESFEMVREVVESRGMECLMLDQTRADVGIPVVKMIVPGLRHYRRRLAAGRLYSVPETLGWLAQAKPENHLNPQVLAF